MYRIEVDSDVAAQIAALPSDALPGLLALVDLLTLDPWNVGEPYHSSRPAGGMRAHTFGPAGHGLLIALIDEPTRRVLLVCALWVG